MTLHTLNKQAKGVVQLCISALSAADSLLLFEDGVYAALDAENAQYFAKLPADIKLYVLTEDLEARGMTDKIPTTFAKITYRDFVSLSLSCSKVVNWN
jgi:tRNA 2-thiouridine synthesizing protein B